MPLSIMISARRCTAKAKSTQSRCWNPAAHGCKTCRMHGARKPQSIKRGQDHCNYSHGERTLKAEHEASRSSARIERLEVMARRAGLIAGHTTRGRKAKPRPPS